MMIIIITRGRKKDVGRRQRMGETWLMMVAASCLGNLFFFLNFIYFFIIYSWGPVVMMRRANVAPPAPPLPADGRGTRLPAFQPGLTIKTWATVARG